MIAAAVARALASVRVVPDYVPFFGGLDTVTPPLQLPRGFCRAAQNFEASINGGYERFKGYERFDGRSPPSDGQYAILNVTITGTFAVGDTITGETSGATAVVLAVVTSGTPDYLVITKIVGTFVNPETLNVAAVGQGTTSSTANVNGASTAKLHAQYNNLAADEYRDDILAVPGSGIIRGVWMLNDVVYAFKNNAGGTACAMYKSSVSGWTAVALGRQLSFTSGGVTAIAEGNTITGAISGATAVITRVVVTSGTWAGGDAAGKFIFASQTGTFQAENIDVGATLNLATIAGNSSAITLLPDGRFEFITKNFGGKANTNRMYGCDRINKGFEFDGTVFVPIDTGMTTDTPNHVREHKNHLFFAFAGSMQHSGLTVVSGTTERFGPYNWSVVVGAGELAMGDTVTGFMDQPGGEAEGAMAVFTRNKLLILYGNSSSDWNLIGYKGEIGAYAHSIQKVGTTLMLDDRGVTTLATSANYGNFADATISQRIQGWVNEERPKIKASCIARDKNQYRLFFSDAYALFVTMDNKKLVGMMPMLFIDNVECVCSLEKVDGSEAIYFGSDDGFVYQMEKGTSMDGDAIEAYLHLAFNNSGGPRVMKSYRNGMLEVTGDGYAELQISADLGYASSNVLQQDSQSVVTSFSAAVWDDFTWDAFIWDGQTLIPSEFDLRGDAENVSLKILTNADYFQPVKISGVILNEISRRLMR